MAYCAVTDLLLGDLSVSPLLSPDAFINAASEEMDSHLGYIYIVPINTADPTIPPFIVSRLKIICLKLASGRLMQAMDSAGEHTALQAYGETLLQEAYDNLADILEGERELINVPRVPNPGSVDGNGATILNYDRQSGVDAFYDYVNTPAWVPVPPPQYSPWWRPGPNGGYGPISGNDVPQPGTRDPDPGGLEH